jgi:RNA methyltransferase, TrmH family
MLTKNRIKEIKTLESKKYRLSTGLFVAEGKKLISELSNSLIRIETLLATSEVLTFLSDKVQNIREIIEVTDEEINKTSFLKNPQGCIALCRIPDYKCSEQIASNNLVFCLDNIQDPGNLGTIIRLSDWFGIEDVVCSPSTVDVYNPKAIQSTMGAISRVRVHYRPLKPFLSLQTLLNVPVFGTFLSGDNIFRSSLSSHGIITFGNEGSGISEDLVPLINRRITIPDFSSCHQKPDSLNVSVAASIIIAEFRRRLIQ